MRFEAVLFDLDGTLVDTPGLWMSAYRETLAGVGIHYDEARFLAEIYSGNRGLRAVLEEHGRGASFAEILSARDESYMASLRGRDLWLAGARELLESLAGVVPVAIVTAAWRRYVDAMDARPDLERLTQTIVTGEDCVDAPKPHPAGALLAAERLGVPPSACVFVGDQSFDVLAARAAGMTSVLVRGSHTPGAVPEPSHEAADLAALGAWLL